MQKSDLRPPFRMYILKENRTYLWIALAAFALQFLIFKLRFPYINYMPDSYAYLEGAFLNIDVGMWPVAYSKFLRAMSAFTHMDGVLAAVQYLFIQLSGLFFLFSTWYFLNIGKVFRIILYVFFVFNPITLYISNYVSADALFMAFSLLWMTTLVWVLYRPGLLVVILHAILLVAAFTVRYNAIYYPLITAVAFLLSPQSWLRRLAGIGLGLVMVGMSVLYTSNEMYRATGTRTFSPFGGWQMANNALYMYEHVGPKERKPVPARFAGLEAMVRQHMDTLSRVQMSFDDSITAHFYLWNAKGPLMQHLFRKTAIDTVHNYFTRWASMGPLYGDYGLYLIRQYPGEYASNYLSPNLVSFILPHPEYLGVVNMSADTVGPMAKDWFHYKSQVIMHNNKGAKAQMSETWLYSYFSMIINVVMLTCLISLGIFTRFRFEDRRLGKFIFLGSAFWLVNMAFSILASPIVLRYQLFPLTICFTVCVLGAEVIYKLILEEELNKKKQLA